MFEGRHQMNALASRQLGSADKAFGVHQVAHTRSGFYHRIPCHSLTSVEVDYDLVGSLDVLDLRILGMQLDGPFRRARGTLQYPPPKAVFPGRLRAFDAELVNGLGDVGKRPLVLEGRAVDMTNELQWPRCGSAFFERFALPALSALRGIRLKPLAHTSRKRGREHLLGLVEDH
jgi:hypothetical protein